MFDLEIFPFIAQEEIVIVNRRVRALHPSCRRFVQCFDGLSLVRCCECWWATPEISAHINQCSINTCIEIAGNFNSSTAADGLVRLSSGTLKQKVIIKVITASTHSFFVASAIEEMGKQFHATCNYAFFHLLEALHLKATTFMSSTHDSPQSHSASYLFVLLSRRSFLKKKNLIKTCGFDFKVFREREQLFDNKI